MSGAPSSDRPAGEATKYDAHPFEARPDDPDHCAVCGEHRRQILHHPTRIRAARALRAAAGARTGGEPAS